MKLLFLNHNVRGRGTYVRAYHLARELVRRGHEVTLVTTSERDRMRIREEDSEGVRVVEVPDLWWGPARTGWDPYNTLRRIRHLRSSTFDLVHAFDSRPAVVLPALRVAADTGAPLVMDWADWWGRGGTIQERSGWAVRTFFGPIETWFEESFRTRAQGATVISSALRERCIELGVPAERVLHLPDGSRPWNGPAVDRAAARVALGLNDAPVLVHVGVAHPGDAALLFEAFRRARTEEPAMKLVMAGAYRGAVPADLAASRAVRVTGYLEADDLRQWLAAADACVAALRDTIANRGRWPSKINEYLAAGRMTVMTNVSDLAGRVRAAGAGRVATPEPGALARAMVDAVRDREDRTLAEQRARTLAASLAWDRLAGVLDDFYASVLGARAVPLAVSA